MNKIYLFTLVVFSLIAPIAISPRNSYAHPGNTASDGCHYCRTNCSSWGVAWNARHCHGGYSAPEYSAPIQPWKCTIGDRVFYSHSTASDYWYSKIDASVKDTYKKLLERDTNDFDISYWHSKFPYNNCNGGSWNAMEIWNEVISSDEKKALLAKKEEEADKIKQASLGNNNVESSNSNCYIATAVYGSGDNEKVVKLRNFRDQYLLKSDAGTKLVDFYYKTSPPVAQYISDKPILRKIIKEAQIDPIVWAIDNTL